MKKIYLLPVLLLLAATAQSQVSFSDDFESYTAGQTIGVASSTWATWSGNVAGEDAPVTTEQAHGGTKSAKFYTTTANGGPTDVILPFGGAYDLGKFELSTWMYVTTGRGGYFNFQSETTPGTKWALDIYFDKDGKINANSDGNTTPVIVNADYPVGAWFNLKFNIDLTANKWVVLVNDVVVGAFANTANKIASIDFYGYGPAGSLGQYYLDDLSFTYTPHTAKPNDAVMYGLDSRKLGLTGDQFPLKATLRNVGQNAITSFDATVENGASSNTYSFSGQNIDPLATASVDFPQPYTLVDGTQDVKVTFSNINGGVDDDPSNNDGTTVLRGYTPAPGKSVVVEEATGTWCQWCVRGIVFMKKLREYYPNHFIGIGVHNADPMTLTDYDAELRTVAGFAGFPEVLVQRQAWLDPSAMELPFLEAVTVPAPATLINGASYDAANGLLTLSVTANFTQSVVGDYRLNAVILEDEVTGTGSTWAQKNAYAGGASGPMGGFESLPSSVPAAQMVYNDVARGVLGGFLGLENSVPTNVAAGTTVTANFTFQLGVDNDFTKLSIAGLLTDNDGLIANASLATIDKAIANGLVVTAVKDVLVDNTVTIAPNPASGTAYINLSLAKTAETGVRVFNALGQQVAARQYGMLAGEQMLPFVVSNLQDGVYTVQVTAGGQMISRKLVVRN